MLARITRLFPLWAVLVSIAAYSAPSSVTDKITSSTRPASAAVKENDRRHLHLVSVHLAHLERHLCASEKATRGTPRSAAERSVSPASMPKPPE